MIDIQSLLMGKALGGGGGSGGNASYVVLDPEGTGWFMASKVGSVVTVDCETGTYYNGAANSQIRHYDNQTLGDYVQLPEGYRPNGYVTFLEAHNKLRCWIDQDGKVYCETSISGGSQGALRFTVTFLADDRLPKPPLT